jgi:flagella basal body P-ring formation protein FlgA
MAHLRAGAGRAEARRRAAPDSVAAARVEPVIRRGDPVVIEAGSDGFSITREGVAMADAAPGAHFLVRIDSSRQPVQAVALASGRATLPGWAE